MEETTIALGFMYWSHDLHLIRGSAQRIPSTLIVAQAPIGVIGNYKGWRQRKHVC